MNRRHINTKSPRIMINMSYGYYVNTFSNCWLVASVSMLRSGIVKVCYSHDHGMKDISYIIRRIYT